MKTFENYNTENKLIELVPPNDIEIKFDFDYYENHLFFLYNNKYQFAYHKKSNSLNVNTYIYGKLDVITLSEYFDKYFNIKFHKTHINSIETSNNINDRFNNGKL